MSTSFLAAIPLSHHSTSRAAGISKSELKKRAKALEKEKKAAEKAAKQQELALQQAAADVVRHYLASVHRLFIHRLFSLQDFATESYGLLPLNQSQTRPHQQRAQISSFSSRDGETVLFRARVHTSRAQGNKMVFLNLRQRFDSVQALLTAAPGKVSKQMVKWAAGLADESIVLVGGTVQKTPELIKSATISDVEVHITKVSFQVESLMWSLLCVPKIAASSDFWH